MNRSAEEISAACSCCTTSYQTLAELHLTANLHLKCLSFHGSDKRVLLLLQSTERAMAVACLQGNCNEAEMYPSREKLVYWRAVLEGMEPTGLDGMPNDPKEYFENGNNYNYLVGEHLKACSSKRGELAGKKGIRGVFETKTTFNMARAKTPLEVMAMTALAEGLSGKTSL